MAPLSFLQEIIWWMTGIFGLYKNLKIEQGPTNTNEDFENPGSLTIAQFMWFIPPSLFAIFSNVILGD